MSGSEDDLESETRGPTDDRMASPSPPVSVNKDAESRRGKRYLIRTERLDEIRNQTRAVQVDKIRNQTRAEQVDEIRNQTRAGQVDRDQPRAGQVDRDQTRAGQVDRDQPRAGQVDRDQTRAGQVDRDQTRAEQVDRVRTEVEDQPRAEQADRGRTERRSDVAATSSIDPLIIQACLRQMEANSQAQDGRIDTLLTLLTQQTGNIRKQVDVKLTSFDVDDSPYSMREWLEIADKNKTQHDISDEDMILKVGEALRRRALYYFRHWKPLERTWPKLVSDLVSAFPISTTPYMTFVAIANERSRESDTLSTYCHRKLHLLQSFQNIQFNWNAIRSIVEGCLDNHEAKIRIKQMRPENETELITIMGQIDNEIRIKEKGKRKANQRHETRGVL